MNFYKSAALALDHLDKNQGSVKGSLSAAGINTASGGEARRVLALLIETLKYRPVIQQLLEKVPLMTLERITFPRKVPSHAPSSSSLLHVLLHDLLFSNRMRIEASDKWPPKEAVLRHQARLKAELVRIQICEGKQSKAELARSGTEGTARYIRWNPNTDLHRSGDWSLSALYTHLAAKGFTKLDEPVYPVPESRYFLDPHLPEVLLVFPPETTWWMNDEWYEAGAVILQDKASCFPAKVLMEGWAEGEEECLDATAAPGNKTSYVSALMGDKGRLYAFEKSQNRFKTLEKMLGRANCKNVVATRGDFTETNPKSAEYSRVTRILLDPSCSGSGIVNRLDYLVDDDNADEADAKAERLEKLAAFQYQMILHAFKFPSAQRIVYSTCSIHAEEDEQVVLKALGTPTAKELEWTLSTRDDVLPKWERRGRPEEMGGRKDLAESLIRCVPGEDKTNGFFVACFVRGVTKPNDSNGAARKGTKRSREMEEEVEVEEFVGTMNKGQEAGEGKPSEGLAKTREESGDTCGTDVEKAQKAKTVAQLARKKRKRQSQKARRDDVPASL